MLQGYPLFERPVLRTTMLLKGLSNAFATHSLEMQI